MRTEKEILKQIKTLENAIENNKPGERDDGIILSARDVINLNIRHKTSIIALRWVLNVDDDQCPVS